jgi:phosphonate transport system substrate-binding protein
MPRSFLLAANINPEKDFRRIAYSGAHDATIASVVSGKVDAAALDITVWRKFVTENKVDTKAVDVFYTTPGYYNYNWSVHADMPAAQQAKVKAALLALDPAKPDQAEILRSTAPPVTSKPSPKTTRGWKQRHAAPACSDAGRAGRS